MTTPEQSKPPLHVTVFSDYICPFCYIGFVRLEKLREKYDLKVNWALIEIHPDNPESGRPVSELGYSQQQLDEMSRTLAEMADGEDITLSPHTITTNSRRALILAEACKEQGADIFYAVHRRLFEAYFSEGLNIADPAILLEIVAGAGLTAEFAENAWQDPVYATRLQHNMRAAVELEVTGTPTYFFGDKKLTGAVPVASLMAAADAIE